MWLHCLRFHLKAHHLEARHLRRHLLLLPTHLIGHRCPRRQSPLRFLQKPSLPSLRFPPRRRCRHNNRCPRNWRTRWFRAVLPARAGTGVNSQLVTMTTAARTSSFGRSLSMLLCITLLAPLCLCAIVCTKPPIPVQLNGTSQARLDGCMRTGMLAIVFVFMCAINGTMCLLLREEFPCATGLGSCSTISCISANVYAEGCAP